MQIGSSVGDGLNSSLDGEGEADPSPPSAVETSSDGCGVVDGSDSSGEGAADGCDPAGEGAADGEAASGVAGVDPSGDDS